MKIKALVGILVFLIVINVAAIGTFLYVHFTAPDDRDARFGRPGPRGMHGGPFGGGHPLADLPDDQRQLLFDMMREFRESSHDHMQRAHELEDQAFELMRQDDVPKAQVDSLLEEIASIRVQVAKDATTRLLEVRGDLTPEQREHLYNAILRMRPKMGPDGPGQGRRGGRGRRPPNR